MSDHLRDQLDLIELRSRAEGLQDRLNSLLQSADEALSLDPPRVQHARERLDDALHELRTFL